jgi:hypothetical protein
MHESTTYQEIIEEGAQQGEMRGARKTLLRLGTIQFGPPSTDVIAALESINSLEKLEELQVRLLKVSSWKELLGLR